MNQLVAKVHNKWQALGDNDRRILKLATPVILFLLLYLVLIQPILGHYLDVRSQRQQMQESLVWLYENSSVVSRMQNACSRERPVARGSGSLSEYVQNIGRRAGAQANVRVINNRELELRIEQLAGARALGLLQSYVCSGFDVANLRIARASPEATQVELSVRLSATNMVAANAGSSQ